MRKSYTYSFSLCSLFILMISCLSFLSSCKKRETLPYETIQLSLSSADNAGLEPIVAGDTVNGKSFALAMNFTQQLLDTSLSQYLVNLDNQSVVTDYDIYALESYNAFPPGQSLKQLFTFTSGTGNAAGIGSSLSSIENNDIISRGKRGAVINDYTWLMTNYLLLMTPPQSSGNYHFCVWFDLSNGSQLRDTLSVYLLQ